MSTWLTTIVINSARMKLRRRLSQVQVALDEPWGEQNLSLANTLSDTRPDPEEAYRKRQIAKRLAHATSGSLSPAISRLDKRVQRRFDVILQEHSYRR
jgi:DNA-directed RNA polymerase specialized sigma24 family protein